MVLELEPKMLENNFFWEKVVWDWLFCSKPRYPELGLIPRIGTETRLTSKIF
jgi:hypothetical protein